MEDQMKNRTKALQRLTLIMVAALVVAALPESARAAVLAEGAGLDTPAGAPKVALLQQRLWLVGIAAGPVDGRFGPLTAAAVRRYQDRDGLAVDGIAGPRTQAALRQAIRLTGRGAGYGSPHGSGRVRRLQQALAAAGARPA